MAMDVAECDRMIAACRAQSASRWALPTIATSIRSSIACARSSQPVKSAKPVVAQIDAFERFNPQPHEERHWFVKRSVSGGGPMFDFGCHRIELLLSFFGPVRRTVGLTANVVFDREVEDTAVAAMTFASGPCATVTVTHAAIEPSDTLRIFGTTGRFTFPLLNAGDLTITGTGRRARDAPAAGEPASAPGRGLRRRACDRAARRPWTGTVGRAVAEIEARIYRPT